MADKVEPATPDDAPQAAALAAHKRAEYEAYSPVFWRVAPDAVERHEPFLRFCLGSDDFTSFAVRIDEHLEGVLIAQHRVGPPPLTSETAWLVDDFFVSSPGAWSSTGRTLLAAAEDAARSRGAEQLVVLTARRDEPKRTMLEHAGYTRAASWWVHPVVPSDEEPPPLQETTAVVGPAPPVYDPGGTTALAFEIVPGEVEAYDRWAAASGAVLAIAAARSTEPELEDALERAGYTVASDWFAKTPRETDQAAA